MNQTVIENTINNKTDIISVPEIILTSIDVILVIVITIGNTLTISAVCRFRTLQKPHNVMIVFLSVCDLVMGPVYTPVKVLYVTFPNLFVTKIPCFLAMFLAHFSAFCAAVGLSALSLERAYAVHFPFHYHSFMTIKLAATFSGFALTLAFFINLPFVAGLGNWDSMICLYNLIYPAVYIRIVIFAAFAVFFVGFAAFLRVLVAELRRKKHLVAVDSESDLWERKSSRKSRLMCVIYLSSLALWSPHLIYYLHDTFANPELDTVTYRSLSILDLSSSAVNFFIYGFKNSKFRRAYMQLLGIDIRTVTPLDLHLNQQLAVTEEANV